MTEREFRLRGDHLQQQITRREILRQTEPGKPLGVQADDFRTRRHRRLHACGVGARQFADAQALTQHAPMRDTRLKSSSWVPVSRH